MAVTPSFGHLVQVPVLACRKVAGARSAARRQLRQLLLGDRAGDSLDRAADVFDLRVESMQRIGARVRPATARRGTAD